MSSNVLLDGSCFSSQGYVIHRRNLALLLRLPGKRKQLILIELSPVGSSRTFGIGFRLVKIRGGGGWRAPSEYQQKLDQSSDAFGRANLLQKVHEQLASFRFMSQRDEEGDRADSAIRKMVSEICSQSFGAFPLLCRKRVGKQTCNQLHPSIGMGVLGCRRRLTCPIYVNAAVRNGPDPFSIGNSQRVSRQLQRPRDAVYYLARRHHLHGLFHIPVAQLSTAISVCWLSALMMPIKETRVQVMNGIVD